MALRISTGRVMLLVAITAVGLGVIQFDRDPANVTFYRHYHEVVVAALPMVCLLLFGILCGVIDLVRTHETPRFLVGFELLGWMSILVYLAYCAGHYQSWERPLSMLADATSYVFPWSVVPYRDPRVM